ncbi:MAG: serine/threonine protein kinase [Planctomycetaceae bacterium]|nr:serine/threonine protein kinase [Planctomycetaceae bacterium]
MSQAELAINGYELVNCIATGTMTQVWEVKQTASSQSFAMKLLLPEALKEGEQKQIMRHEASVGKRLDHPNIIRFVESKITRKYGYIVMELFRSQNLKSLIRGDLHATHARLRRIMECCTQAFAHMHEKGYLHKDIKPDNVLVTKGGEVRVIDFSLAGSPSSAVGRMMTRKKNIAIQGTRTYIAPEQIRREKITTSSDIYSLGVMFYEALTGRPPFLARNPDHLLMAHVRDRPDLPSSYHRNISSEVDDLVMRMLAKKPKDRPESMQQVFTEVRSIKIFKQDPEVFAKEAQAAAAEERLHTIDQRLDSRKDAARTEQFGYRPMQPAPPKSVVAEAPPTRATSAPAAPQPAAPPVVMPQQPMYPPAMYPMGMPQTPMMPMQPMMYPPGMPQPFPQPMMPGYPQGAPMGQPYAPPPVQPPVPTPTPPQAPPPQQPPQANKDLEAPDNLDWLTVS